MSKWTCSIIQEGNKKYYAVMEIEGKVVEDLPTSVDYKTLKEEIKFKTGIEILKHKEMIFEKLSKTEKIATIDATQYRERGMIVTIEDRVKGWKPCWSL